MIRIPQKSDIEVQNAFKDVQESIDALEKQQATIAELTLRLDTLQSQVDSPPAAPTLTRLGDTVVAGDLRVEGDISVVGDVAAPQILDGAVVATPPGTGGSSLAQQVVEVHGSLAVLNALSAETGRFRNLQVYRPGGLIYRLHTDVVDVSNTTTTETNLMTYTLPASILTSDGQTIRVMSWGTFASNGNRKPLKAYFGATSTTLWPDQAINGGGNSWRAQFEIVRTGAATQILIGHMHTRDATPANILYTPAEVTPAETLTGAVIVKMTGASVDGGANQITQKGMIVELLT